MTASVLQVEYKVLDQRIGNTIPLPTYSTVGSAAMDLRAVFDGEFVDLLPNETKLIGTGIALYIAHPGYCGLILPRSGLGNKGIVLGNLVGLIDSDYQGELKISLWNRSQEKQRITLGERIAQFFLMPVYHARLIPVDEFSGGLSTRAEGGFGHTGQH